jgi:hypothetical protein
VCLVLRNVYLDVLPDAFLSFFLFFFFFEILEILILDVNPLQMYGLQILHSVGHFFTLLFPLLCRRF